MQRLHTIVRLTFCVATMFAVTFLAQANPEQKPAIRSKGVSGHDIRIVDQNGRPVPNGVRSPAGQTVDVQVGPGFSFSPDTVNISVGDT
ncbi:MAG: hypothetical protein IRY93_02310, partial [Chthoniobacterales bacterium]|nr:hypothetical protein [Chthoniobacterales bacterium]